MIRVPIRSTEWRGATQDVIIDENDERDGTLYIALETHNGEAIDDRDIDRTLTPDEARAIAAALWHFAAMADWPR